MRALFISFYYMPFISRQSVFLKNIFAEFKNYDIEIDLVTSSKNIDKKEIISDNIFVHYIDTWRDGKDGGDRFAAALFSVKAYNYAKRLMSKKKYNFVHCFGDYPSGTIGTKLGLPFISDIEECDFERLNNKLFPFNKNKKFDSVSSADAVVVHSETYKDTITATEGKIPINISYGADSRLFAFDRKTDSSLLNIIMVENTDNPFLKEIIRSVTGLDYVRLKIIGSGRGTTALRKFAAFNNVSLEIITSTEYEFMPSLISGGDIFLRVNNNQTGSMSAVEAMSTGMALIISDNSGDTVYLNDNGFILPAGELIKIREILEGYRLNPSLLKKHSKNSHKAASAFTWKKTANALIELYKKF